MLRIYPAAACFVFILSVSSFTYTASAQDFRKWKFDPEYQSVHSEVFPALSPNFQIGFATITPYAYYSETPAPSSYLGDFRRGARLKIPLGNNWSFIADGSKESSVVIHGKAMSTSRSYVAYDLGNDFDFRATQQRRAIVLGFAKKF